MHLCLSRLYYLRLPPLAFLGLCCYTTSKSPSSSTPEVLSGEVRGEPEKALLS